MKKRTLLCKRCAELGKPVPTPAERRKNPVREVLIPGIGFKPLCIDHDPNESYYSSGAPKSGNETLAPVARYYPGTCSL